MTHIKQYGSFPKKVKDLPTTEFYAILTQVSVFITEDDSAKRNGYHDRTEESWSMEVFLDKSKWESEIQRLITTPYSEPFKAVKITPANIVTEVVVKI